MKSLSQHILEHFANIDQSTNTEIVQESKENENTASLSTDITSSSSDINKSKENKEEETED